MSRFLKFLIVAGLLASAVLVSGCEHETASTRVEALIAPLGTVVASQEVGALPGSWSIGQSGASSYTLPLVTPVGRGVAPSLSVRYSSGGGNGLLGVGFALAGAHAEVRPCQRNPAIDGTQAGVSFSRSDVFCLGDQRLIEVGTSTGPDGFEAVEYRFENSEHSRITSRGQVGFADVPAEFVVEHASGTVEHYGHIVQATQVEHTEVNGEAPSESQVVFAWAKSLTADQFGNQVQYVFEQDAAPAPGLAVEVDETRALRYRIKRVLYSANPAAGLGAERKVEFIYEQRPDVIDRFSAGVHVQITQRLAAIEMWAPRDGNTIRVWDYRFSYNESPSQRSQLSSLSRCDHTGACLPATDFTWAAPSQNFAPIFTGVPDSSFVPSNPDAQHVDYLRRGSIRIADFDADGLDDVLFWDGALESCTSPDDGSSAPTWGGLYGATECYSDTDILHVVGEWKIAYSNGNGVREIIPTGLDAEFNTRQDWIAGVPYPVAAVSWGTREPNEDAPPDILDVGFDGIPDLFSARQGEYDSGYLYQALGSTILLREPDLDPDARFISDFNGDGRLDYIVHTNRNVPQNEAEWVVRTQGATGAFGGAMALPIQPNFVTSWAGTDFTRATYTVDTDGDGRSELLFPAHPDGYQRMKLEDDLSATIEPANVEFSFDVPGAISPVGAPLLMDINGDGLRDWVAVHQPIQVTVGGVPGYALAARFNTGNGFGRWFYASTDYVVPSDPSPASDDYLTQTHRAQFPANSVRVLDLNADGRSDFVILAAGAAEGDATMFVSNGRGFDRQVAPFEVRGETHRGDIFGGFSHHVLDHDGDGLSDILYFDDDRNEFVVWTRDSSQQPNASARELLVGVRNGMGREDWVDYASGVEARAHYEDGVGCVWPQVCARHPGTIVVAHRIDAYSTEERVVTYDYADLRTDLLGRGSLGMGYRRITDVGTGSTTEENYDNETRSGTRYPFAGIPSRTWSVSMIDDDNAIAVENRFVRKEILYRGGDIAMLRLQASHQNTWEVDWPPGGGAVDPANVAHSVSSLYSSFDSLNFPRRVTVSRHDGSFTGSVRVTTKTYSHETGNPWILGLSTSDTVRDTTPDGAFEVLKTTRTFNDDGTLRTETREPLDPSLYLKSRIYYDDVGNVIRATVENSTSSPVSPHQQFTALVRYQDPERMFATEQENTLGHVVQMGYEPSFGAVAIARDPNGVEARTRFDGFGRVRETEVDGGMDGEVDYLNGTLGEMRVRVRTQDGHSVHTELDRNSRPLRVREKLPTGWSTTLTHYDERGRVWAQSLPYADPADGRFVTYEYDLLDRVVAVNAAGGGTSTIDRSLYETISTDPSGRRHRVRRSVDGRVKDSTDFLEEAGVERELITSYAYGPFGRLEEVTDPSGVAATFDHDRLGRVIANHNPDTGSRSFTLDAFGRVLREQNATDVRDSTYDGLGRLLTVTDGDGTSIFEYDLPGALGALHRATSADGVISTTAFDSLARPIGETIDLGGGEAYSSGTTYDSLGRVKTVDYPEVGLRSLGIKYTYTGSGHLQKVRTLDGETLAEINERDGFGAPSSTTYFNGVEATFGRHDDSRRPEWIQLDDGGVMLHRVQYNHNHAGDLIQRTTTGFADRWEGYDRDSLGRLSDWYREVDSTWVAGTSYEYNDSGSLLRREQMSPGGNLLDEFALSATHPRTIESATRTEGGSSFTVNYDHDDAGRRVLGTFDLATYTSFDLPRQIKMGGMNTDFTYDAFHGRVVKEGAERVVTLGSAFQHNSTTNVTTFRVPLPGATLEIEQSDLLTERRLIHNDIQGSPTAFTNSAGTVSEVPWFSPFGRETAADGTPLPDIGAVRESRVNYTGHESDLDLGLINMRGRMFDPATSRFLSPDPLVSHPLSGQSFNPFSYVMNQPMRFTDPSGFGSEGPAPSISMERNPYTGLFATVINSDLQTKDDNCDDECSPGETDSDTHRTPGMAQQRSQGFIAAGNTDDLGGGDAPMSLAELTMDRDLEWDLLSSGQGHIDTCRLYSSCGSDRVRSEQRAATTLERVTFGVPGAVERVANGGAPALAREVAGRYVDTVASVAAKIPIVAAGVIVYQMNNFAARVVTTYTDGASSTAAGEVDGEIISGVILLVAGVATGGRTGGTSPPPHRFYHGTTRAGAESVVREIRPVSEATAPHPSGSFFTHASTEARALEAAGDWPVLQGHTNSSGAAVVQLELPHTVYQSLVQQGLVVVERTPGLPYFPRQTVFLPAAFPIINSAGTRTVK